MHEEVGAEVSVAHVGTVADKADVLVNPQAACQALIVPKGRIAGHDEP
jgi:hypothetical protein